MVRRKVCSWSKGNEAYTLLKQLKRGEEKGRVRSAGPVGISAQNKKKVVYDYGK